MALMYGRQGALNSQSYPPTGDTKVASDLGFAEVEHKFFIL